MHIHAKVHLDRQTVLTTQFYFDDTVSTKVFESGGAYESGAGRDAFNDDRRHLRPRISSSRSRRRATATSG